MPDTAGQRCDIKTVMLLPACARQGGGAQARAPRRPGSSTTRAIVTEGASINAWIVDQDGRLITRQIDNAILRGVTRTTLIDAAQARGHRAGRAAVYGRGGRGPRGRRSSPRRPTSSCRSCASTDSRSATAHRACSRRGCAQNFTSLRKLPSALNVWRCILTCGVRIIFLCRAA